MPENSKLVFIISFLMFGALLFSSPVTAAHTDNTTDISNWDIEMLHPPYSFYNVSASTPSIQIANLTTNSGAPINDTELQGSFEWEYDWANGDSRGAMTHYRDGLWYVNLTITDSVSGQVNLEAAGETLDPEKPDASNLEANATRKLNYTYYITELADMPDDRYNAGESTDFAVNVSLFSDRSNEDQANVNLYFTNVSWTSDMYSMGYNPDRGLYTQTVSIPNQPKSTYFMHVNASTLGSKGVASYRINTYPSIDGNIEYVNGTGVMCDTRILPTSCEPGAEISTGFNITSSSAQSFNITRMVRNETGLYGINRTTFSGEQGFYETSFKMQEFNTSNVDNELILQYRGTNGDREVVRYYNITKEGFYLDDNSLLNAYQGSDFEIRTFIGRPQSLRVYPNELLKNGSFTVTDPDGEQLTNFSFGNMTYDEANEVYTEDIEIPSNATTGSYTINADVFNVFDRMESLEPAAAFRVREISQTFTSPAELSYHINNSGIIHRNFTLENSISSEVEVNATVGANLSNTTSIVNSSNITIPGDGNTTEMLEFNVTEFEDLDGEIALYDQNSPYNTTMNLSVDMIECGIRGDRICFDHDDEWFNISTDERGTTEHSLQMYNVGPVNESANVSINVTGEIAEYISLENNSYMFEDKESFNFNMSSSEPTEVTGGLEFIEENETTRLDMAYEVDVEILESSMELLQDSVNIGVVPRGEDASAEIEANNTGSVTIVRWFASSDTFDVSLGGRDEVAEGETEVMNLMFANVSSESGTVTIEGQTGDENMTTDLSVTASVLPPFSELESNIEDRRSELETQATGEALTMLSDITVSLSELETQMQNEQYSQAQSRYQEIQSTLDEVETMIEEQDTTDPGGDPGDTNSTDPGDPGTDPGGDPGGDPGTDPGTDPGGDPGTDPGNTQGGGIPVVPIAIIVFLILVIGFVVATSYIPEPGDPLYDLLGEG